MRVSEPHGDLPQVLDPRIEPASVTARGRIDKREAILAAAFDVFSREGYGSANVDAIAAQADVAKPTIYAHFGSKERLFRAVMADLVQRYSARSLAALEASPADGVTVRDQVLGMARRLVTCYRDPRSSAFQRLLYAEAGRFPDLWESLQAGGVDRVVEALAGRLARFANAGQLTIPDPVRAARQLVALITSELPDHATLGARPLDDAQIEESVAAGVETFLRAFARDTRQ
jgi:AcrR family transcriptional regulator